jgi:DNA-directed RNA polymerase subunit RPC12/RpoP
MPKYNMKGRRLYRCDECRAESYHHWVERNRAARMRCPACGSCRLELVSEEAKQDQASLNQVRVAGHRSMTLPPDTHDPKKKVTG